MEMEPKIIDFFSKNKINPNDTYIYKVFLNIMFTV